MDADRINYLYDRYIARSLSPSELDELRSVVDAELFRQVFGERMDVDWDNLSLAQLTPPSQNQLDHVFELLATQTRPQPIRRLRKWLPYAAAIILMVLAGTWLFVDTREHAEELELVTTDIPPGGNRATLTLADGRTIDLSEEQSGVIVGDGLKYLDGSEILDTRYQTPDTRRLMSLSTPKGGTYQITLPDGSQVWLNAASTLKYPSHFTDTERVVEISGEAYFSIAEDQQKPFKVISEGQEIEVLGTMFNVSAYPEDHEIKTTLVEGAVQIVNRQSNTVTKLAPGEQSAVRGTTTHITQVDTEQFTAWKNGFFYFKKTPLEDVLRQVSRWYDVNIDYRSGVPKETLSGDINRDVSLLGLLEILQVSTIDVSLEGRTVIVH